MFDLLEVKAESPNDLFPVSVIEFLLKFAEGEMKDVVVVNFLGSDIGTELKPNAV